MKMFRFLLCWSAVVIFSQSTVRANVYATDIKINGNLLTLTNGVSSPVAISYRLNQAATLGVTVGIWQGSNQVAAINGGTNMGLNTVVWGGTNNSGSTLSSGTYSVTVTAAASGFTNWQQISVDTNAGNYAFDPNGMAVDNNTNSPYYGRVVVGCSEEGGHNPVTGSNILDGIYKMNADGSFADEGGFGYGGYVKDDAGDTSSGEMPSFSEVVPYRLRIGGDDRIYMDDYSGVGAIVSFDILVTSNEVVIDDGGFDGGTLGGPHSFAGNPDIGDLAYGINNFDVTSLTTSNAAVWLCDGDSPSWGIWMYRLTNGQSDISDFGTQSVTTSTNVGLLNESSGGCAVDANLDIFCGQNEPSETAVYDALLFANWNRGVLPPISSGANFATGFVPGEVDWGYGCGVDTTCTNDPTFEGVQDVVINSRTSPTIVACPMAAGNDSINGIRLLNATNGSIVASNLDFSQDYTCAAWDNVGNLYGASSSRNVWRVWSPPGPSTNTTTAPAQVILTATSVFKITSISAVPSGSGSTSITIDFEASGNPALTSFTLLGSSTLNGTFTAVSGANFTGSSGVYQVTVSTTSSPEFYKIEETE
jgi:hypothetical protein